MQQDEFVLKYSFAKTVLVNYIPVFSVLFLDEGRCPQPEIRRIASLSTYIFIFDLKSFETFI